MSQYVLNQDEEGIQVASNLGWSDFCDWARDLPAEDYPSLHHLVEYGYDNDPEDLHDDIEDALENSPPDADVASTAEGLIGFLDSQLDAEIIIISNGMTADVDA
jgi:hypothetical protein